MAAAYIADLTEQLTLMARAQRLEMLAYLLDMARLEAEAIIDLRTPIESPAHASGELQERFKI